MCLDETSKELDGTPRGSLPRRAGESARQDDEYERHGVCNLFLAIEPLRGWRSVRVTDRRMKLDFAEQLRLLVDQDYPHAEKEVAAWTEQRNDAQVTIDWQFTTEDARVKLKHLYPVIEEQIHVN